MGSKLANIKNSRFWDASKDIVMTKKFGVVSSLALLLVKAVSGKTEVKVTCSDVLSLKDFKELLSEIKKIDFDFSDIGIENGYPVFYVNINYSEK